MTVKEVLADKIINREDTYIHISHAEFMDESEEKTKFVLDYCSSCEDMDIHDFDEYEVDLVLYKVLQNGLQINVVLPDEEEAE